MDLTRRTLLGTGLFFLTGCSSGTLSKPSWMGGDKKEEKPESKLNRGSRVGDMVRPYINILKVEATGLVVGLDGTGSDPLEGSARNAILAEMRTLGVENPNAILQSTSTAVVNVRTFLRPGMAKGDPIDVELVSPLQSDTKSLRGGRMLQARLMEMIAADGMIRKGRTWVLAAGPVLVDPTANPDEPKGRALANKGVILGGGRVLKERPLTIRMLPMFQAGKYAKRVQEAINKQFGFYEDGHRVEVAKAHSGVDIEIRVHPRYRNNLSRYLEVILSVPLSDSPKDRTEHIQRLKSEVGDPRTTVRASLELEAFGKEGVPILKETMKKSSNPGVQLCTAEALAYLNESDAAETLGRLTTEFPEYKVFTLSALSALNDYMSVEQLLILLDSPSASTRYGAFRSLRQLRPDNARIAGEYLNGKFWFHHVASTAEPMVHVTKSRRPEVSIFGGDVTLKGPFAIEAGSTILVNARAEQPDQVRVSRFVPGEQDQIRLTSTDLEEVIRAVVELNGDYPDVVQMLQMAKDAKVLPCRFEIDALPKLEQTDDWNNDTEADSTGYNMKNPLPDLFSATNRISLGATQGEKIEEKETNSEEEEKAGLFSWLKGSKEDSTDASATETDSTSTNPTDASSIEAGKDEVPTAEVP